MTEGINDAKWKDDEIQKSKLQKNEKEKTLPSSKCFRKVWPCKKEAT